jgi:hypothetical protein
MTLSEALEQKRELQTLLESTGWKLFKEEMLRVRNELLIQLYQPKEVLANNKEHMSGVVYGISTYLDVPDQMMNLAQSTIDVEKKREEELSQEDLGGEEDDG